MAVVLGLGGSDPASGCTCVEQEGWSIDAARAGGAVFAEVVPLAERVEPVSGGLGLRTYTAAVRRAIGLVPGATIRIVTPLDPAACGVVLEEDAPRWLLLHQQPEGWSAELCAQLSLAEVPDAEWDRRAGPPPD